MVVDAHLAISASNRPARRKRLPDTCVLRAIGSVLRTRTVAKNAARLFASALFCLLRILSLTLALAVAGVFGGAGHSVACATDFVHTDGVHKRSLVAYVPFSCATQTRLCDECVGRRAHNTRSVLGRDWMDLVW